MVTLLIQIFIKNQNEKSASSLCHSYALVCGMVGIVLNMILFSGKIIIGSLSHSVAMSADAFNNLGDAGSSLIAVFGFWIAGFGAGKEHPFGHGRMEWLIGLFTSLAVIFIGVEFAKSSIASLIHPQETEQSLLTILVLVLSIFVKLYMYFYNSSIGKKICSSTMKATATDCLSDCAATSAVLISSLIKFIWGVETDGWCGLVVSMFIVFAGYCSIKDVMERIMGIAPNKEFAGHIREIVKQYTFICCVYDLTIHDYGFERFVVAMRIVGNYEKREVLHTVADDISYQVYSQLNCQCTVQVDYIYEDKEKIQKTFAEITEMARGVNAEICMQNFRMTQAENTVNIALDLIMPSAFKSKGESIKKEIIQIYPEYRVMCNIILLHNHPMPIRI